MSSLRHFIYVLCMTSSLALCVACSTREEKKPAQPASQDQGIRKPTMVVEPTVSKGKWRAVMIGVTDKQSGKESVYEVPVRATSPIAIPNTDITIMVVNFLPHFIMQGTVLTSQSNEPKNPAAQIQVYERGKEIFMGWLFALYPTTHAFLHPRYGFSLKGSIPA